MSMEPRRGHTPGRAPTPPRRGRAWDGSRLATIALLALTALPTSAFGEDGRRFGLFVGSNAAPAGREPLLHAERDARRVREVFVELGGVSAQDALLLEGADPAAVLAAVSALAARVGDEPGAVAVFYYSGHADDRGLLLGDATLPIAELRTALDGVPARIAVQILDACRAGAWTRRKGPKIGPEVSVQVRPQAKGRVVIASTAAWEDAQESDRLGGSFFTLHFVSALRGAADADGDGAVTLSEAYAYVYDRTVESTMATLAGPQHPTYRYDLSGQGDTHLTWPGGATSRAALRLSGNRQYAVFDSTSERLIAEVRTPADGGRLALRPGSYRVQRRDTDSVLEGDVDLLPDTELEVDAQLDRRRPIESALAMKGPGPATTHVLRAGAGWRGALGEVAGAGPTLRLGYAWQLRDLRIGPRLGLTRNLASEAVATPRLEMDVTEVTVGAEVRFPLDLRFAYLVPGVAVDGVWLRQSDRDGGEADRDAFGVLVGALLGVRSPSLGGFAVFVEGEADAVSFPVSDARRAPTGSGETDTVFSFRAIGGVEHAF